MKFFKTTLVLAFLFFFVHQMGVAQKAMPSEKAVEMSDMDSAMKTFIIERDMPSIGNSSLVDLQGASKKSCTVLDGMGADIQWVTSYVTQDKIYCVYKAKNKDLIEEHAKLAGFPANSINEVAAKFVDE